MKIQSLLVALVLVGASMTASANEDLIAEMDKRLNADPELACRLSYNLMVKVIGHEPPQFNSENFPQIELAPRVVYMKDCLTLPQMVQKCLVDKYAYHRLEDCQQARQGLVKSKLESKE